MHDYPGTVERRPAGWLARAVVAGFIAIGVVTVTLVVVSGVAGALGEAFRGKGLIFDWMYELTHNPVVELGQVSIFGSLAVHLTVGMFWAVLYALAFEPRLRQYPGWQAGLIYSMLPFFLSITVFLPLTGAGLLGSELRAGPLPLLGNLILHMLWGATLGAGYSAGADRVETVGDTAIEAEQQTATMSRAETGAARGILIGAVAGGVLGAMLGAIMPPSEVERLIGSWAVAMGVGGGLAGGAVGALVGSMTGLTEPAEPTRVEPLPTEGQPLAAALVPLAAIAMVATFIVTIGSTLLTVAPVSKQDMGYYYGYPIAVGLTILLLVTAVATIIDRTGRGHREDRH